MKKIGFTLAEVLITLGIIGVVAALTLPTLSTNAQNQANASKLSSTVSDLENALGVYLVDKNEISLLNINDLATNGFTTEIQKYMKNLGSEENLTNIYDNNKPFKDASGSSITVNYDYILLTKSGAVIILKKDNSSNVGDGVSYGYLYIDVNGSSPPNKLGKDFFSFYLGEDGVLYPMDDATKALIRNGYKVK